jgi:exopolysaccharide biosynthesis polyprenyl glycosylphosphotransferase
MTGADVSRRPEEVSEDAAPATNGVHDSTEGINRRRLRRFARLGQPEARLERTPRTDDAVATSRRRDSSYRIALVLADIGSSAGALLLTVGAARLDPGALVLALATVVIVSRLAGLYDRDPLLLRRTTLEEAPALFQAATLFTLLTFVGRDLLLVAPLDDARLVWLWASLFGASLLARWAARKLLGRWLEPERCLLAGSCETARDQARRLAANDRINAGIVGWVPLDPHASERRGGALGRLADLTQIVEENRIERVIVAPRAGESDLLPDVITRVKAMGIKVSVLPRMLDVVGSSSEFDAVGGATLLGVRQFGLSPSSAVAKRAVDVLGGTLALVLLSPLLILIAVTVRLSSPGPVLFRQTRIGRDGRPFRMLKFRSMRVGADAQKAQLLGSNEAGEGLFKIPDDPRTTRLGRHLRRTALDELPQLVNVLRGEMSLVGPRPLIEEEDQRVAGWHRRRLHLRPGITGPWQVLGSAKIPLSEVVTIDYLYAANWSLWGDVKILLRTVLHVFGRRGL